MSVRVKICGITSLEDALLAVESGADALGFIFHAASPRNIAPAEAKKIIGKLPPFVTPVGVFVNQTAEAVAGVVSLTGIHAAQLHGDETPELCSELSFPVIKAFRVKDRTSLERASEYNVSALLLDSYVPGQLGGTGARFNWELAIEAIQGGTPVILAGGLTPDNIAEAVVTVAPFAVDVSSGVELAPGRKDAKKVREFIRKAKNATGS